jgi:hypothetical protein
LKPSISPRLYRSCPEALTLTCSQVPAWLPHRGTSGTPQTNG